MRSVFAIFFLLVLCICVLFGIHHQDDASFPPVVTVVSSPSTKKYALCHSEYDIILTSILLVNETTTPRERSATPLLVVLRSQSFELVLGGRLGRRRLDLPRSLYGSRAATNPVIHMRPFSRRSGFPFSNGGGPRRGARPICLTGRWRRHKVIHLSKVSFIITLSSSCLEGIDFFLTPHHFCFVLLCVGETVVLFGVSAVCPREKIVSMG